MTAAECREAAKIPVKVVLDNVRSLNNVGAILRTCDAFSIDEVIMCGITGVPPSSEIHKTALGAEDSVSWRHMADTQECVEELKAAGWHICVLEQTHNSVLLQNFNLDEGTRYVIVAGNEVHGVEQAVADLADTVIEIPQEGAKHSLNVSVSAGIALWHFFSNIKKR